MNVLRNMYITLNSANKGYRGFYTWRKSLNPQQPNTEVTVYVYVALRLSAEDLSHFFYVLSAAVLTKVEN
jgi:hypothetical protein